MTVESIASRTTLSFGDLKLANVIRCEESFHGVDEWTPSDWGNALAGEVGEACNLIKKLRRMASAPEKISDPDDKEHAARLIAGIAKELADVVTYADLCASRLGIDLGEAVRDKFNEVSGRVGSSVNL